MASKKITRTLIESYDYDVMRKEGTKIELVGVLHNPTAIRSMKEQREVLVANKFLATDIISQTGVTQKVYEMSDEDFRKYASVVKSIETKDDEAIDSAEDKDNAETTENN